MTVVGILLDVGGWMGAAALIVAYGLVSWGRVSGSSDSYQTLNLGGSFLLLTNSAWHRAWPSAAVNLVWIVIAIGAVLRKSSHPRNGNP